MGGDAAAKAALKEIFTGIGASDLEMEIRQPRRIGILSCSRPL
jgi:hypothetical protein